MKILKITDEANMEGNVDAWLSGEITFVLNEAFSALREEYLTSLSFNAKNFFPAQIYEVVHEVYKSQIKALHPIDKASRVLSKTMRKV